MVDHSFVQLETAEALAALERLQSYKRFHDQATIERSRMRKVPAAFEREVRYHADRASRDCDVAVEKMLNVAQHYRMNRILNDSLSAFGQALEESGPLTVGQLIGAVRENDDATRVLRNTAITPADLEQIWDTVSEQQVEIAVDAGRLSIRGPSGREMAVHLPGDNHQRSIIDILYAQQFDAVVARFSQSAPSPIDFVAPVGTDTADSVWRMDDLLLGVGMTARSEMTRHLRQMEQIGIPLYQGRELTLALFVALVLIAVIIAGFILVANCCNNGDPGGGCCGVGLAILVGGLLLFGGLFGNAPKSPTVTTYGNPSPA